jgi:hypothetical protein
MEYWGFFMWLTKQIGEFKMRTLSLKNQDNLSEEEIRYIKRFTLAPVLGVYLLARKQVLIFLVLLGLDILSVYARHIHFFQRSSTTSIFYTITMLLFNILFFWYCFRARRISWNNCEWESFASFQKSEKKWTLATTIFVILVSALTAYVVIQMFA